MSDLPATVEPEALFGPAMMELTSKQRQFVILLSDNGGQDVERALIGAGFQSKNDDAVKAAKWRLMHNPKVIAAINEEAIRRLRSGAILAASAMVEIAMDSKHKDRLKAAQALLAHSGIVEETVHRVIVEDKRTDKEIEEAIYLLAKRNGLDPRQLLGHSPAKEVVDAEFSEVSTEGLEDLLQ